MTGLADVDLTDLDNFASGFPHPLFELHRRQAPVWWHEPTPHTPGGEGFWSVATHAETFAVLRDPDTYSSEKGGRRPYGGTLLQDLEVAGIVLNMMDDPRHARIRRLVSTGLTPRMVSSLEAELRRRTQVLLDGIEDGNEVDFLVEVAAEPGHAISPGDKVLVWEGSANRDERVFDRSMDFDIRRDPNPHLSFGHGLHYCLGANLAKLEMRVVFEELLPRFAAYELAQPVEWTRSNRHTGIRHLAVRLGAA